VNRQQPEPAECVVFARVYKGSGVLEGSGAVRVGWRRVRRLPSKCEALSSNSSTTQKKKRKKRVREGYLPFLQLCRVYQVNSMCYHCNYQN
jgi:hypothetical protein